MNETTAEATEVIDASPDRVWKALTQTELMKSYFMGAEVKTDWREGSPITFTGEFKGKPYEDKGEVQTVEPAKRLAFTHYSPMSGAPDVPESYHVVTFKLEPSQSATKVTLTQSNLTGGVKDSDREHRDDYEKNWKSVLAGLKKVVETH